MGLDFPADVKSIYELILVAGFLHDYGKREVPLDILMKPGKLDCEEFDEIRAHPRMAHIYLKPLQSTYPYVGEIAVGHHEPGYPRTGNGRRGDDRRSIGLKLVQDDRKGERRSGERREDVPWKKRCMVLVKMADILDSLGSKRHYRSKRKTNTEIMENLQEQFYEEDELLDYINATYLANRK